MRSTILERALPGVILTNEQRERVYQLSDGHPLALRLLINQLRSAEGEDGPMTILDQAEAYTETSKASTTVIGVKLRRTTN